MNAILAATTACEVVAVDVRESDVFEHVDAYLAPGGWMLVFFGTSGDIDYLRELIPGFECEELRGRRTASR